MQVDPLGRVLGDGEVEGRGELVDQGVAIGHLGDELPAHEDLRPIPRPASGDLDGAHLIDLVAVDGPGVRGPRRLDDARRARARGLDADAGAVELEGPAPDRADLVAVAPGHPR
ncbi:MAG: hypothetical protein R2711_13515 [Acidimicrobiales bacterium]